MEGGKKQMRLVELIPGHVSKFTFLIVHRDVLGAGMKHNPCKYWTSSFFLSF